MESAYEIIISHIQFSNICSSVFHHEENNPTKLLVNRLCTTLLTFFLYKKQNQLIRQLSIPVLKRRVFCSAYPFAGMAHSEIWI